MEGDFSEQDLENVERWKHMQQSTKPFPHPIRKLKQSESGAETEALIQEQAEEIERLKGLLNNQHKIILEQKDQIKLLQQHRTALIQECQHSGTKIPPAVLSDISKRTSLQAPPPLLHSSSQQLCPQQSSVSAALPPHPHMMSQHTPPPHLRQQVTSVHYLQPPPIHTMSTANAPHNISLSTVPAYPLPPHQHFMPPRPMLPPHSLMDQHQGQMMQQMPVGVRTRSATLGDISFSPLTSSDFKKLERENLPNFNPFPEDLENILDIDISGLPTGAGYGVGMSEEEELIRSPLRIDIRYNIFVCVVLMVYMHVYPSLYIVIILLYPPLTPL